VNLRLEVPSGTLLAYLALAGAGHFLWETAQLPLYTIWSTGTRLEILFAIIHCTAGDLLITVFADRCVSGCGPVDPAPGDIEPIEPHQDSLKRPGGPIDLIRSAEG
jgi:hypothetical protein